MVLVDVEIALRAHVEVEQPMPRQRVEHVVEVAHAGSHVGLPATVEHPLGLNPRLAGLPRAAPHALGHCALLSGGSDYCSRLGSSPSPPASRTSRACWART